ncbi:hypothetical protein BGW41_006586 [Actinomortierella wolfii]|nr:hypothetical protein BGW41_006586 [Actinomortierella wolfii]
MARRFSPCPKGYQAQLGPFTDFQGWESVEQVQRYRNLVRDSLPNSEARNIFNARVPNESVPELFKRLRGRFRPIVSAIVSKMAKSYDPILDNRAEIVGYHNHLALGIDSETMSLDEFLDAHIQHGSNKDGGTVLPFYHPAETPAGPDVVFVLRFDNYGYCPVFVRLKMRHKMAKLESQLAFSTVKSEAVQGHLQEATLDAFCTGSPKRFLGVVIAYPAELAGTEGTFPEVRRSERIHSAHEDAPQCISLRIDKNNIHALFPENHMQALDLLKGVKRELDQNEEPVTKHCRYDESGTP